MDFLKTIGGKIAGGIAGIGVIAASISLWRMSDSERHALALGSGKILAWSGVVLAVPWISFLLIGRIGRMDSNLAGGILVATMTLLEALVLVWLFAWHPGGATAWTFILAGVLVAGIYNLLTCDWIAEKVS